MRSKLSTTPNWTDDDLRLKRMAHGTRAVAAAVIVGGIVIAAIESTPTSNRFHALDETSAATEIPTRTLEQPSLPLNQAAARTQLPAAEVSGFLLGSAAQ